jgi:tetratricopeptide (TPR) repeat protein
MSLGSKSSRLLGIVLVGAALVFAQNPTCAQAVSDSPSYAESRRLSEQGKFDEAIAALKAIAQEHPDAKNLAHEFGVAYYRKGEFGSAVTSLQRAIAENPGDNEAVQLLGLSLYLGNKPAEAIPYLEKVQTWYSSANVDAAYILGICYTRTKAYPQARQAFAKMFGVGPDSASSYLFAARMFLRQDVAEVAAEYAQRAVTLDAKLPLGHQLLGEIYLYQSKFPEAVAQFEKELEINPGYAAGYYKLADAYSRMQKYDDAERLLQRSIWLDATSTGPYILLGKVLEKKGETELAVRALQRAIAMDANNAMAHYLLGQSYRDLGRTEDAEHELKLAETLQSRQNDKP